MIFNSLEFGVFFALVYLLYVVLPHRGQNRMLLVASYIFYGAWDWRFLSLILLSTIVDYSCGLAMAGSTEDRARKRLLAVSITANLVILGFFKYYNFFADSAVDLLGLVGLTASPPLLNIVLPVGISFYTFQTMSYTIDLYRREMEPCRNFLDFALFVSFFPQLVAGPIERAKTLIPQILHRRELTREGFAEGVHLVLWGLFKKVVVADNLAPVVDATFAKTAGFESGEVLVAVLAFAMQIYCDFSGYSDIARGTARLLGFELMLNFNLPYIARNPSDFWRRWHISLSTWLRDYLYLPLGGNRRGGWTTYRNLAIVMLLGGLWHGAAWNFVIWGGFHGLGLAVHRAWVDRRGRKRTLEGLPPLTHPGTILSIAVMFTYTLYGWLLFRAESFPQILNMTLALVPASITPGFLAGLAKVAGYSSILWAVQFLQIRSGDLEVLRWKPVPLQSAFYLSCFYAILILGNFDGASFIYFQF